MKACRSGGACPGGGRPPGVSPPQPEGLGREHAQLVVAGLEPLEDLLELPDGGHLLGEDRPFALQPLDPLRQGVGPLLGAPAEGEESHEGGGDQGHPPQVEAGDPELVGGPALLGDDQQGEAAPEQGVPPAYPKMRRRRPTKNSASRATAASKPSAGRWNSQ